MTERADKGNLEDLVHEVERVANALYDIRGVLGFIYARLVHRDSAKMIGDPLETDLRELDRVLEKLI